MIAWALTDFELMLNTEFDGLVLSHSSLLVVYQSTLRTGRSGIQAGQASTSSHSSTSQSPDYPRPVFVQKGIFQKFPFFHYLFFP